MTAPWICPRCERVNAPTMMQCTCMPAKKPEYAEAEEQFNKWRNEQFKIPPHEEVERERAKNDLLWHPSKAPVLK